VRARRFVRFVRLLLIIWPVGKFCENERHDSMDENETVIVRTQNKIKRKRGRGGVSIIRQPEEDLQGIFFETKALE